MAKRPDKTKVGKINIALPSADREDAARKEATKSSKNIIPNIPGAKWNEKKHWFELPAKLLLADPEQPRKTISEDALEDLKADIEANGLINPIVIRNHPDKPGHYMIVNGERRFLAFDRMTEKRPIPVTLNNSADKHMQFRDNYHRENFTTAEIFSFFTERLAAGETLDEIKSQSGIGKSNFTKYSALLKEQNAEIKTALMDGRITSLEAAYSLSVLTKKYAKDIASLIASASKDEIDIKTVATLKERLKQREREKSGATEPEGYDEPRTVHSAGENGAEAGGRDRYEEAINPEGEENAAAPPRINDAHSDDSGHMEGDDTNTRLPRKKVVIKAKYEGKHITILAKMPETSKSHLWIRTKAGDELEVKGDEVTQPRAAEE